MQARQEESDLACAGDLLSRSFKWYKYDLVIPEEIMIVSVFEPTLGLSGSIVGFHLFTHIPNKF